MAVKLEKSDISMLVSLVALEMGRCGSTRDENPGYYEWLQGIRDKLLAMLASLGKLSTSGNGDLPEFREYARKKYGAELNEDLITIFEDLINMRRQELDSTDVNL